MKQRLHFLLCPDSFKESLTAQQFNAIVSEEINFIYGAGNARITRAPLTDGGEGFASILTEIKGGKLYGQTVTGPMGTPVKAQFGYIEKNNTAIIEMAQASGLPLVTPDLRNPLKATTYGTGELINHAIQLGADRIILGIGGSATVDAGCGMAQALGYRFYQKDQLQDMRKGAQELLHIDRIEKPAHLNQLPKISVLCDVTTPLSRCVEVFAPQKGADTPQMMNTLSEAVNHIYHLLAVQTGIRDFPGAGAAGGLGYGLKAFANGTILNDPDSIFKLYDLDNAAKSADYIITGEGRLDNQILEGKVIGNLLNYLEAAQIDKPVIILCGYSDMSDKNLDQFPLQAMVFPILNAPVPMKELIEQSEVRLRLRIRTILQLIKTK